MFEKYTGLPDVTKSTASKAKQRAKSARDAKRDSGSQQEMEMMYSPSRGGSSGGSSGQRGSSKKKRYRRRRITLSVMTLLFLALIVVAIVVLVRSCSGESVTPEDPTNTTGVFRNDVYINGANVSGKTIAEVSDQLRQNEEYAINNIAIRLEGDGFSTSITGENIDASSNLDEVLQTALSGSSGQVYYTTISFDDGALAQRIDEINASMTSPPTDASFTVEFSSSGKPKFNYVEGTAGYGLDVDATVALVKAALDAKQYQTTIKPMLTTVQPSVTVADVQAHTTQIGSFTTTYDFKGTAEDTEEQRTIMIPNRAFNVEKATDAINNQVIKPGRTWSFNDTVGDRDEKNGWELANGIFGGDRFTKQYGGGVCQVSTTLYNAVLDCYPYVTINRRKHSIPSTYVEKGLDATVDTGHIDFTIKNTSEYPMYIFAYVSENKRSSSRKRDLTVLIYGEALPEGVSYKTHTELVEETLPGEEIVTESKNLFVGEEQITAEARNGYIVDVYIDRYLNGELQESKLMYTDNYESKQQKRLVGIKPTPTPEPTPTPRPTKTPNPEDMP